MKRLALFIIAALLLAACDRGVLDPAFIANSDIRMEVEGKTVFVYDPIKCQQSFNAEKRRFIVHTDTMSDYYLVTLNDLPSEAGTEVRGDVTWTTSSSGTQTRKNVAFKVAKLEGNTIWLWSARNRIQLTVNYLK